MGDDETALFRLCREKRGEVEPQDLSGNLIAQLGVVIEPQPPLVRTQPGEARPAPVHTNAHKRLFVVFDRFPEAHSRPSPVLVDELDSSTSQHRLD
jgi:hypothetical protein